MVIVVMGVAGCGKSTIAELLGARLRLPWHDGDAFHPAANIAKMKSGIELCDADRLPWLTLLADHIARWEREGGAVLACSALKESYRKLLAGKSDGNVVFTHLVGSKERIFERMRARSGHYMPLSLIDSQFAALEPPTQAITVSIDNTPEEITRAIIDRLADNRPHCTPPEV
jgi:gluconokinase